LGTASMVVFFGVEEIDNYATSSIIF
jgi:hypothetical protein